MQCRSRARTDRWKVSPIGRPAHVFALEIALYLCRCEQRRQQRCGQRCEQRCEHRSLQRAKEAGRRWGGSKWAALAGMGRKARGAPRVRHGDGWQRRRRPELRGVHQVRPDESVRQPLREVRADGGDRRCGQRAEQVWAEGVGSTGVWAEGVGSTGVWAEGVGSTGVWAAQGCGHACETAPCHMSRSVSWTSVLTTSSVASRSKSVAALSSHSCACHTGKVLRSGRHALNGKARPRLQVARHGRRRGCPPRGAGRVALHQGGRRGAMMGRGEGGRAREGEGRAWESGEHGHAWGGAEDGRGPPAAWRCVRARRGTRRSRR